MKLLNSRLRVISAWALGLAILTGASDGALSAKQIEWKLENGFRMFLNPADTQLHVDEYANLTEEEKRNPIVSLERRLGRKHKLGWAEKMYESTCWHRKKHTYVGCRGRKKDYLHPRSHRIIAKAPKGFRTGGQCQWRVYDAQGKGLLKEVGAPCSGFVKLNIPYPQGAMVEASRNGRTIGQSRVKITDLFIVGLGDSFGSGEGNPDDPAKFTDDRRADYGKIPQGGARLNHFPARKGDWTWIGDGSFYKRKARWNSRSCHRSLYSHQLRVALQLATENTKRAVTFVGLACSGAESLIGLLEIYKGNEWHKYKPKYSQISQAARASCGPNEAPINTYTTTFTYGGRFPHMENLMLHRCDRKAGKHRKIDFLLVSIGGNDVGFSRLVANAVLRSKATLRSLGGWMGQIYRPHHAEILLSQLDLRYKAVNRAFHNILHIPWKESDRIILTAYPKMAFREDGETICPNGSIGMDLHPLFNVKASKSRQGELFAEKLFVSMQWSAHSRGWTFVTEHRDQFARHGYCAVDRSKANSIEEILAVPRWDPVKKVWHPYPPSLFRAYLPRQRWIRTPNDVYMGTHQHVKRVLLRKVFRVKNLNPFQLIYAGTYGGSFHPTAEGQAVIADAVLKKVHGLMKKYKYE